MGLTWVQLGATGEAIEEEAEPRVAVSGKGMVKEADNRGVECEVTARQGGIEWVEREQDTGEPLVLEEATT